MVDTPSMSGGQDGAASTLIELARLAWRRPAPHAPAAVVAVWYEAKTRLHERLAAESGDGAGRVRALSYAARAREHAAALRAGTAA